MQTYCQTDEPATQREKQKAQSRAQILRAAITAFANLGFDAASMADIARQAGVKKALVQYHFETKENLWRSAVSALWAQRDQELLTKLEPGRAGDGREALRQVLYDIVRFFRGHPEWLAIVFRESSQPGTRLDWLVENHLGADVEQGIAFVGSAQAAGLLPAGPPLQLLNLITGALSCNLLVAPMAQRAAGVNLSSDEAIDEQVDLLMNLLQT